MSHEQEGGLYEQPLNRPETDERISSPYWVLAITPIMTITLAATVAPRIAVYTTLACIAHKPEYTAIDSVAQHALRTPITFFYPFSPDHPLQSSSPGGATPDQCASDPIVQAAVATLTLIVMTANGILSCLTTAWWGSLSDRRGRRFVLGICTIGALLGDLNFIITANYIRSIPSGYWSLLVGPLMDGLLGGQASVQAAIYAYITDSTNPGTRSQYFSLYMGLLFVGLAIGPMIGSALIHYTQQPLSVFSLAAVLHLSFILIVWGVLPESLSPARMEASMARWKMEATISTGARILKMSSFFSPLKIFLPRPVKNDSNLGRDWNMTLFALASACLGTFMGSFPYKFQYATAAFGWTPEMLGYWLSAIGASRVVYLVVVLPALIKLFNKQRVSGASTPAPTEATPLLVPPPVDLRQRRVQDRASFDLALARVSIAIEATSYIIICAIPTTVTFAVLGVINAVASGLIPAMRSVALEMYHRAGGTESGRLFGGLSMINALCSQILGPAVFGVTYASTVASFPRAIFFLSLGLLLLCGIALGLVRLSV